jgi:hypothetical protein
MFRAIDKEMTEQTASYDQEEMLIEMDLEEKKKVLLSSLSDEAKDIISIIQDCPEELKEVCLAGKLDKVSLPKLIALIRKQWRQRLVVREIFREVFSYATKIKELNAAT